MNGKKTTTTKNKSTKKPSKRTYDRKKREQQKEEFYEYCDRVGIWNVVLVKYEEETGIPVQTLSRWKLSYMTERAVIDSKTFPKELLVQGKTALRKISLLMNSTEKNVALKASNDLLDAMKKYAEFMQNMGLTDIIQEREQEISLHFHAEEEALYNLLTPEQKKKLADILEGKHERS